VGAYAPVGRGTGSVELAAITRAELYSQARQLGIPGRSRMNKEELARAVRERARQAVRAAARQRRSRPWATMPAVFRAPAWRSLRLIPPLAVVMLSAAIGATTPMLLVDSSGELGAMLRADLPAAYVQPAFAQPGRVAEAANAPAQDGASSSRRAAPTIVLAEASGDSTMGSASPAGHKGTEMPPGDSGPTPSGPPADDGDEPGGEPDDPGGGGGDPGEDDPRDRAGPHERSDGHSDEEGKGKGRGNGNGEGKGNGKGKGTDEDRGNGKGKGKDGEEGEG
jgi:hypothetical protein